VRAASLLELRPPCEGTGEDTVPPYADPGASPSIRAWSGPAASRWIPPACLGWPGEQRFRLLIGIAGQVRRDGDVERFLDRAGAISRLRGLSYWSISDQAWRVLVTDAAALDGPDPARRCADFSADELKAGQERFFLQADRRIPRPVVYRLRVLERGPDRVAIETANVSAIRALFVTLFPPGSLRATWFLTRAAPGVWSVYGLSGTGESASVLAPHHEASYVNRAVALYGFLTGAAPSGTGPG